MAKTINDMQVAASPELQAAQAKGRAELDKINKKRKRPKGKVTIDNRTGKILTSDDKWNNKVIGMRNARKWKDERFKVLMTQLKQMEQVHEQYIEQFKLIRGLVKEAIPNLPEETMSSVEAVKTLIKDYNALKAIYEEEIAEDIGSTHDEEQEDDSSMDNEAAIKLDEESE